MSFGARALIRLAALKHNLATIKAAAPGCKFMAVIKANAYGHGMLAVAKALPDVDALAVARVAEGEALRAAGISARIVLLAGIFDKTELESAIANRFDMVVHCDEQLPLLQAMHSGNITVWLKLDTGMNRLGFAPPRAAELLQELKACAAVKEVKLMTHMATADDVDDDTTAMQLREFSPALEGFEGDVSIANSPATFGWPQTSELRAGGENWIRSGIALYGISPFADKSAAELGLQPVMQFEARLIAVKPLRQGSRVGYHGSYEAPLDTQIGILSAGYGDGYSRHFRSGTPVLINDRKVALIGRVSMDMIAVDLGADAHDRVGDTAVLWGDGLAVEEVAPWADAIPYELVCGVMNREASVIVD